MPGDLLVWKFGGTSLGDGERVLRVRSLIVDGLRWHRLVVVCSAMGETTDVLLSSLERAEAGDVERAEELLRGLERSHLEATRRAVEDNAVRSEVEGFVRERVAELSKLVGSVALLRESTPRTRDLIASYGERLSTKIVWGSLRSAGVRSVYLEGHEAGIVTDSNFGNASPLMDVTYERVRERLGGLIGSGSVPVVTGYIASTPEGIVTTLGRGGSDLTATVLAYCLDAKEVWLWTDVDGMMSADPRVVPTAKVLNRISYDEAVEMAYFGAKGLQIKTILPAREKGIPIRVKNTFNPDSDGTLISGSSDPRGSVTKAVLMTKRVASVTVKGEVLSGGGLAAKVLSVIDSMGIEALMVSQSVSSSSISVVVPRSLSRKVAGEIRRVVISQLGGGEVEVEDDVAAIAVIGEGMKGTPGVASRVFGAVASRGINVRMIAQGSSELNISFVVKESDAEEAVRAVHSAFFGP
ncbi:MAG: aspartate kinase [Thaumarchaeota archaeon]|nr:aspartate kinase [Candidatus Calditenuaceae archaeon]MDW8042984.1 aspartate kinase [Nitrososphaerota archaeon]